jgi:MFS family permease
MASTISGTAERRPAMRGLISQPRFRAYGLASTVSVFGDGVTSVAVPLIAVLFLRAGPVEAGVLSAMLWAPSLLCALPFGVRADRVRRHGLAMIAADVGRGALLAGVTVSYMLGVLGIVQLCLVVFGVGVLSVWFTVNDVHLFALVVSPPDYVAGQSLLRAGQTISMLVGPSLGGLLVQVLPPPVAVSADALSYTVSALLLSRARSAPRTAWQSAKPERGRLLQGLVYVRRTPPIRRALSMTLTINFFNLAFTAVLLLYLADVLGISAVWIGLILGAGAAGGVTATGVASTMIERLGVDRTLLWACRLFSGSLVLVPAAAGGRPVVLVCMFAASVGSAFGRALVNVGVGSVFMTTVPGELRARVRGAFQFASNGLASLGGIAGGWLGYSLGLRWTLWIGVLGSAVAAVWLLPETVRMARKNSDSPD